VVPEALSAHDGPTHLHDELNRITPANRIRAFSMRNLMRSCTEFVKSTKHNPSEQERRKTSTTPSATSCASAKASSTWRSTTRTRATRGRTPRRRPSTPAPRPRTRCWPTTRTATSTPSTAARATTPSLVRIQPLGPACSFKTALRAPLLVCVRWVTARRGRNRCGRIWTSIQYAPIQQAWCW